MQVRRDRRFFPFSQLQPIWNSLTGVSQVCSPRTNGLIIKTASSGWGNAGVVSLRSEAGNCRFSYYWRGPCENNKMIGIGTDTSCNTFSTIDFGLNLQNPGTADRTVAKYENGSAGGNVTVVNLNISDGVLLEIERIGSAVSAYYTAFKGFPLPRPGLLARTSIVTYTGTSSAALYINLAMDVNGVAFDAADMIWEPI